jgi:hypothetical protein
VKSSFIERDNGAYIYIAHVSVRGEVLMKRSPGSDLHPSSPSHCPMLTGKLSVLFPPSLAPTKADLGRDRV